MNQSMVLAYLQEDKEGEGKEEKGRQRETVLIRKEERK